jgi:hypothetical protein
MDYEELERWRRVGFERGMRSGEGSGEVATWKQAGVGRLFGVRPRA